MPSITAVKNKEAHFTFTGFKKRKEKERSSFKSVNRYYEVSKISNTECKET